MYTKGPSIVARESAASFEAAIDQLVDKLERQIERYRDKRTHELRRQASRFKESEQAVPPEEQETGSPTDEDEAAA